MNWNLFVFQKGFKHYLVPAESEDAAWEQLQKRLSWKMEVVKKACIMVKTMNCNSEILSIN